MRIATFVTVGLKNSTYLTRNNALRTWTANGLSGPRPFSAAMIAFLALPLRIFRTPWNIRSKLAILPTGSVINSFATSWKVPSIERAPVEVYFPSNAFCSERPWISCHPPLALGETDSKPPYISMN